VGFEGKRRAGRAFSRFFLPLILVGTIWRLWASSNCEESSKSQPVFSSHVDKLYSIANLEIARHNNASCAHLDIIQPEHNFQLGSYFQREHHLYVKTADAEISGFDAERRCGPLRL